MTLKSEMNTPKPKTALFAGSFNPFTFGHLRIVERGLKIADRVIIAIGYNINKGKSEDLLLRLEKIRQAVEPLNKLSPTPIVEVREYAGLTAEFAKETGADFLLRGVRNNADFEYERNLADVNLKILGIDTVILFSEPEYGYISSSMVRELAANGFDTSSLTPTF